MSNPEPGRVALAEALRGLRQNAGLSTYDLAQRLGWSQSTVSRLERGEKTPDPAEVAAWCSATGAPQGVTAALISDAEAVVNVARSYRQAHSKGIARAQQDITAVIASSSLYRCYWLAGVPGMLQTPLYAQRILEMVAEVSGGVDVPAAVSARMNRQALLYSPERSFEFVIAEWALAYRAGPPDVMAGQAAKIIDMMALPNVSISVIPNGTDPGTIAMCEFVIYYPPAGPWVLIEHLTGIAEVHGADVAVWEQTFTTFREAAVTGEAAQAIIRAAMTG